jgi:hypothetical protein
MRIHLLAATLLLAAFLPSAVQAQAGPKASSDTVRANPVAMAELENAGIVPCHLNLEETPMASPTYPGFEKNFLVPNGGRCTSDLVCASKCCTNGICQQNP